MHVEILVEEPSAEAALRVLAPRLLGAATCEIRTFQGKPDLLKQLPDRLRAYPHWIPHKYDKQWCAVVLIDEDREDCHALKTEMERIARAAGLTTKTEAQEKAPGSALAPGVDYQAVTRIAVEELEAWFFGDVQALEAAYPRSKSKLGKAAHRKPDEIKGGTAEALGRVLSAYYPIYLPKYDAAQTIAPHMDPDRNTSPSFRAFRNALRLIESVS